MASVYFFFTTIQLCSIAVYHIQRNQSKYSFGLLTLICIVLNDNIDLVRDKKVNNTVNIAISFVLLHTQNSVPI